MLHWSRDGWKHNGHGLADGALNCWSVISSLVPHTDSSSVFWLVPHCQEVSECQGTVAEAFKDTLERVKWTLWHGKPEEAESAENPDDECHKLKQSQKLADLYDYLSRNQAYLVNYQERSSRTKLTQVAESHIESMINARHKKEWEMQWTEREHIKFYKSGVIASNEWGNRWQNLSYLH